MNGGDRVGEGGERRGLKRGNERAGAGPDTVSSWELELSR